MTVDQLSIEAYYDSEDTRKKQIDIVYHAIRNLVDPSSSDISRYTSIPRTSVTARLKKLEDDGMIVKNNIKRDEKTGKRVHTYRVKQW